jgi:DNA repair protein RecN (Recombination protein N)
LIAATESTVDLLDAESTGVRDSLARAAQSIAQHQGLDGHLDEARQLMDSALIQIEEASLALGRYRDRVEINPEREAQLDTQMTEIHALARKHRVQPEDLAQKLDQIRQRLETAAHSVERENELLALVDASSGEYRQLATRLSEERMGTARKLGKTVSALMQELGMQGGRFEIQLKHDPERPFRPSGLDEVQFLVSANPGQAPKSLAKVASGGELSRISLAIKVALIGSDDPISMIFDEVDSGVGGAIAQIVGERLRSVADQRQVFCVTHLPQVAACGHQHFCVSKGGNQEKGVTTEVSKLDHEQTVAEIARMLGGLKITDQTTAHARQMIESTQR